MTRGWLAFLLGALLVAGGAIVWRSKSEAPGDRLSYTYSNASLVAQNPSGAASTLAVLLAPQAGDQRTLELAERLLGEVVAIVIVPWPEIARSKASSLNGCTNLSRIFHAIAKDAEHRLAFERFRIPVLGGIEAGASVAYLGYRQSGAGEWAGLLTIERPSQIELAEPPCLGWGRPGSDPGTYVLDSRHRNGETWVDLPDMASGRLDTAISSLLSLAAPDTNQDALPLTMIEPAKLDPAAPLVVIYSGDGGWAGFDRKVAAELARRGHEVAGISSLEYFWQRRDPPEAARDLQRLLEERAGERNILLVGYSFGADVLPFIYDALPAEVKARVIRVDLLGLAESAEFEFHLGSWADVASNQARPTVPFLDALEGGEIRCIRGTQEAESACPRISNPRVEQVTLPGDHHFDDDARAVVDALLRSNSR